MFTGACGEKILEYILYTFVFTLCAVIKVYRGRQAVRLCLTSAQLIVIVTCIRACISYFQLSTTCVIYMLYLFLCCFVYVSFFALNTLSIVINIIYF